MTTLQGGERIEVAGRSLEVAYTPGHASHHVSYFSAESGVAFVGDTAGVRVVPNGFVLPPTPPPDIDLEIWAREPGNHRPLAGGDVADHAFRSGVAGRGRI